MFDLHLFQVAPAERPCFLHQINANLRNAVLAAQHRDVVVQRSVTTTPKVPVWSHSEKLVISCISRPSLTASFASGSSLKWNSLFFKPHPHSLDSFPACLLETVEPSPFLVCLFSFLPTGSSLLSQELSPLIISHPELTPCTCAAAILHFSAKFHPNNVLFS